MLNNFYRCDYSVTISRVILLTLVALLPFMGGCSEDENPILDDDHNHEHEVDAPLHADADGFNLEVNGEVVYHQHQGAHEGNLTVSVGEEIEVHVIFIDANEEEVELDEVVPPGEHGDDEHGHDEDDEHGHDGSEAFSLGLTGYDSSIIDIHLHGHEEEDDHEDEEDDHEDEEHGEEEALHFEVVGLKAGETKIDLQLLHGDHPDFTAALPIPVTVK
ncbi:hypothetical protein JT359_14670 [Candidatus Poribacteria bacterium]|nr:hypothetical protein [Candidatus Poribacteria bacterium]